MSATEYDRARLTCGHITHIETDTAERWFSAPNSVFVKCSTCGRDLRAEALFPYEPPLPTARGPHRTISEPETKFGYTKVGAFPSSLRRYRITTGRRRIGMAEQDEFDTGWRTFDVDGVPVNSDARYGSLSAAARALKAHTER